MTAYTPHKAPRRPRGGTPEVGRSAYEAVASEVHYLMEEAEGEDTQEQERLATRYVEQAALALANAFSLSSDRFDPWRFIQQCDIGLKKSDVIEHSHALRLRVEGIDARRQQRD